LALADENTGVAILRRALEMPMRRIVENAGLDGAVVIAEIRRRQAADGASPAIGYDVVTNEYVDMFAEGIIDPAKVTRSAVENASSIAAMILSTEALITDIPAPEPPAPAAGPAAAWVACTEIAHRLWNDKQAAPSRGRPLLFYFTRPKPEKQRAGSPYRTALKGCVHTGG
jgi:hypothetical protein